MIQIVPSNEFILSLDLTLQSKSLEKHDIRKKKAKLS